VIYQDPLAYLLGLEGIVLLDAWAGDHDRAFTEARLAEVRRLLDDEQLRDRGVLVEQVSSATVYEQVSAGYDGEAGGGLLATDEPVGAEYLSGREPGVALDAACGTGRFAEFLASRGHLVMGVDSSPDMLAHARRRVPQAEFRLGELDQLPLPASVTALPTGAGDGTGERLPTGAFHLPNDARLTRFIGAAPPPGDGRHRYVIVVQATEIEKVGQLQVQADSTPAWLGHSINTSRHLLGRAVIAPWAEIPAA